VKPLQWIGETQLGFRAKLAIGVIRRARLGVQDDEKPPTETRSVAELTWPVVKKIVSTCREFGAPSILSWSDPDSASYAWMKTSAEREQIAFADWRPVLVSIENVIPELPRKNPHSGGHWRTWVNSVIARVYAREVGRIEERP
jgi:hypothetical protein